MKGIAALVLLDQPLKSGFVPAVADVVVGDALDRALAGAGGDAAEGLIEARGRVVDVDPDAAATGSRSCGQAPGGGLDQAAAQTPPLLGL